MKTALTISVLIAWIIIGVCCIQSFRNREKMIGTPVRFVVPQGFPSPVYKFEENPLTKEGIALGRKLFYDGRLSRDGITSCASCHQQFAAFSDFEHPLSHGFNNGFSLRNSPGLFNLVWSNSFNADGGIAHIELQPLAPLLDTMEMATSLDSVLITLANDEAYQRMFKAAFGDRKINTQRFLKAMTQFTAAIISADSKYDRVKRGIEKFNNLEARGYAVFLERCASCHKEPLFTDLSYRNIGLPLDSFLNDVGRMRISGDRKDSLKFRVPSLRNVARTAPYFHDGRTWGLSVAVDHFRSAQVDINTDPLIIGGKALERIEVQYLNYFLRALTDSTLLKDSSLNDPSVKVYQHIR